MSEYIEDRIAILEKQVEFLQDDLNELRESLRVPDDTATVTQSTEEFVRVRHGHWIDRDRPYALYECSVCGDRHGLLYTEMLHYNYCPNCGAKMDEPREDGRGEKK